MTQRRLAASERRGRADRAAPRRGARGDRALCDAAALPAAGARRALHGRRGGRPVRALRRVRGRERRRSFARSRAASEGREPSAALPADALAIVAARGRPAHAPGRQDQPRARAARQPRACARARRPARDARARRARRSTARRRSPRRSTRWSARAACAAPAASIRPCGCRAAGARARAPSGERGDRAARARSRRWGGPIARALDNYRRRQARVLRWKTYMVFQHSVAARDRPRAARLARRAREDPRPRPREARALRRRHPGARAPPPHRPKPNPRHTLDASGGLRHGERPVLHPRARAVPRRRCASSSQEELRAARARVRRSGPLRQERSTRRWATSGCSASATTRSGAAPGLDCSYTAILFEEIAPLRQRRRGDGHQRPDRHGDAVAAPVRQRRAARSATSCPRSRARWSPAIAVTEPDAGSDVAGDQDARRARRRRLGDQRQQDLHHQRRDRRLALPARGDRSGGRLRRLLADHRADRHAGLPLRAARQDRQLGLRHRACSSSRTCACRSRTRSARSAAASSSR